MDDEGAHELAIFAAHFYRDICGRAEYRVNKEWSSVKNMTKVKLNWIKTINSSHLNELGTLYNKTV